MNNGNEMSEIKALKNIIAKDSHITIDSTFPNNCSIKIKESNANAKLKEIIIRGFKEEKNLFAFKLDSEKKCNNCDSKFEVGLTSLFNSSAEYINKACDAIIFYKFKEIIYVFICELKSDKPKDFKDQMKNSKLFVGYIISILKEFYSLGEKIEIKIKNILFTTKTDKSSKKEPQKIIESDIEYFKNHCKNAEKIQIEKFMRT